MPWVPGVSRSSILARERGVNHKTFTTYAAQVTRRAADWTHDCLTSGREPTEQVTRDTAKRFCDSIMEVISRIEKESR